MIISISGKPGSGKTTLANNLAKKLKMKEYYMGKIRREMAKERGITLNELDKLGEKSGFSDIPIEEYIKKLGKEKDNFIIQSRTAFHFIPASIKIFLDVNLEEGARRIIEEQKKSNKARNEDLYKDLKDAKKKIRERIKSDIKRYKKYYKIEPYDIKNYDFVLDTTKLTIPEVAEKVLEYIKSKHI